MEPFQIMELKGINDVGMPSIWKVPPWVMIKTFCIHSKSRWKCRWYFCSQKSQVKEFSKWSFYLVPLKIHSITLGPRVSRGRDLPVRSRVGVFLNILNSWSCYQLLDMSYISVNCYPCCFFYLNVIIFFFLGFGGKKILQISNTALTWEWPLMCDWQ